MGRNTFRNAVTISLCVGAGVLIFNELFVISYIIISRLAKAVVGGTSDI